MVLFSIANTIEMSDVNHINILFAIAVNLMAKAEREGVKISPSLLYRTFDDFNPLINTRPSVSMASFSSSFR